MSTTLPIHPGSILPDRRGLGLRLLGVAAVLGLLTLALASLPGLDEVRRRLADAAPGWLAVALALEVGSCLAFVVVYRGVFSRDLGWRLSYDVGMAVQGTNVLVPAGGASGLALGAWALRRAGLPADLLARRTVAFFLVTSGVNFATAILAGGALALGLLGGDVALWLSAGPAALAALTVAGVLALPRVLPARSARPGAGRARRLLASSSVAVADGVGEACGLVRSGNPGVLAGAIGYMALDVAALGAAFQALGALPPIGVLLVAYVVGQLGGLVPVPGGVGGADGGLIAALVLFGTPLGAAAAAVLAYRAFQLGLPALLGAVALLRLPGAVPVSSRPVLGSAVAWPRRQTA